MILVEVFWTNLSEAQASLLGAILTLLAALSAVILGSRIFQGKVTNLKEALDQSKAHVDQQIDSLKNAMLEIEKSTTVTLQRVAEISGGNSAVEGVEDTVATKSSNAEEDPAEVWKMAWERVRHSLEGQASNDRIDGRRRARYGRIDRRNYPELVHAMIADGEIVGKQGLSQKYLEAAMLRQSFRNGKKKHTQADAEKMKAIADFITEE